MARQGTTCSPEEKVSRLAAWRAPRGFVLAAEDLPRRRRDPAG
ncbi:MAG: hypothetical protein N2Z62_03820 [Rhodobacteraceae bacterium]|nr:hypothetical protein [Paracoccaceae bacterium]